MEEEDSIDAAIGNLQKDSFGDDEDRFSIEDDGRSSSRPAVASGKHEFEARMVRDYLMEWYEETPDEFEIDWSQVEIKVCGRLTRASGKFRGKASDSEKDVLKISHNIYDGGVDEEVKKTARHEAVHAWQWQEHDTVDHGPTFTKWLEPFDISVNADSPASEPKYEIVCPNCGVVDEKHRKCKTTENVNWYSCSLCGSDDLSVRQNH